nr:unnamed protein product [Digitaria exilis]
MNNDNIVDLSSDSDDDLEQQPASTSTRFGQNGEGNPIIFEDEDWLRSSPAPSSSKHIHNDNGQYRTLPPSFTNGRHMERARYPFGSGETIRSNPSSYMAVRLDSERGLSASNRVDSVGKKYDSSTADANDNSKRFLPSSFSNGNTSKSTHANVASATRKLPPHFTKRSSQNLGENRMGTNMANGNAHPSSSWMAIGSFNQSSTQKQDDDDVIVYGGTSSHRGLGKTVSTIALIQKERSQQSKFMSVDSDRLKSEALNLDEDDEGEQTVNDEPKKDEGVSSSSTAAGASSVEPCVSQPNNVPDKIAERKRKAKACTSSVSTSQSMTRPAAVYHGGLRTKDPSELAKYDVVVTTYTIVANEVPKQIADDDADRKNSEDPSVGNKRKPPSAKSKSKKKKKKLKDSDFDLDSGPIARDTPEDAVVTICGHVFCYQCIHERITTDENMCPAPNCSKTLSLESLFSSGALRICISGESSSAGASSSADNESPSISQSSYISSKIQAAMDILNSIISTDALTESGTMESNRSRVAPAKAIVFSQWTGMLDLLELSLNADLIQYRRLDGTMSLNSRDKAVKDFNTDPEVRVMIMSLKAGNLGLNMVAACHVILLDLWWNPYAEDQAVDRAHRIGQTRPVTVSRLTIKDTVEDRILALQEEKRAMVSSAFGEDKSGGHATRLTVEDLRYLFKV